jgi:hypothetical protein
MPAYARRERTRLLYGYLRDASLIQSPVSSPLGGIFVRALDPEEGLDIDHLPRPQLALIPPHCAREREQTCVRPPGGAGA